LTAEEPQPDAWFGNFVALDGDTAAIGSPRDLSDNGQTGAAYVFILDGANWVLRSKVFGSNNAGGDYFGNRVSLCGNTLLASARFSDTISVDAGSAYVFVQSDDDGDGVINPFDTCPDTPVDSWVDPNGCPLVCTEGKDNVTEHYNIRKKKIPVGNNIIKIPAGQFRIDVDIESGEVTYSSPRYPYEKDINNSFDLISADCSDCGSSYPPKNRSLIVILQAKTAISKGFGVSEIQTHNYSSVSFTMSTVCDLSSGEFLTLVFTGTVDHYRAFSLYFNMCGPSPAP